MAFTYPYLVRQLCDIAAEHLPELDVQTYQYIAPIEPQNIAVKPPVPCIKVQIAAGSGMHDMPILDSEEFEKLVTKKRKRTIKLPIPEWLLADYVPEPNPDCKGVRRWPTLSKEHSRHSTYTHCNMQCYVFMREKKAPIIKRGRPKISIKPVSIPTSSIPEPQAALPPPPIEPKRERQMERERERETVVPEGERGRERGTLQIELCIKGRESIILKRPAVEAFTELLLRALSGSE
ncbi:hypothetical protein KIPB_008010 [Kipferlia bialata]|uniref:Uncharacterized protein n=1 Tax=Kipferlia bialata TaxID=797122 RepID=A0A9K3GJJ0_9EUKA|nr:hypothetical protein KIPB_008010 [Kipferlia bialata]|eukprot:g8010.t1